MMGDRFDTLEEDFKNDVDLMRRKLDRVGRHAQGEEQKKLLRELDRSRESAQSLLRSMEAEIQRAPAYERSNFRSRLASLKRELDSTTAQVEQATRSISDLDDMEAAHRAKMMQGTRALQRASDSVHRSRQIAEETDEIGTNIVGELGRQGEALERTRDRLHETQSALDKSKSILRGMAFRVVTNKIIMVLIILVELAILAGVIYIKFIKPKNTTSGTAPTTHSTP
ncbi:VTI1B [Bugula neritina]|uniref:VTI1B n=1 Tax=Bugula neritina TaxID=10212 RepID=A0A7J7J7R1_BUGNE|nr:VTI1B [Bugula neritina]